MTAPIIQPWHVVLWHAIVENWETIQFLTIVMLLLVVAWVLRAGYKIRIEKS